MQVAEMIAKLQELDPQAEVGLYMKIGSDEFALTPVTDVKPIDDEMQPRSLVMIDYDPDVSYLYNEDGIVDPSHIQPI